MFVESNILVTQDYQNRKKLLKIIIAEIYISIGTLDDKEEEVMK